ncbi:ACP phosphodiesterase [Ohtaekwangia kribbensis]|jgi:acyl carrier protein phosphodiesterase|uniref:ACP phosphodiesterase n=1 Tax=Ohtaekwangia kribbensis TaxID=688913 RepID=A0ABW3K6V8_9BACT
MNFLAHLYLSGGDPEVMVGNFIGDFVKGRSLLQQFNASIVKGIELHRAIDEFTDKHAVVKQSKDRLRPTYRHYAGVIVDVFYDHYLARYWDQYHDQLLPDYAEYAYTTIEAHDAMLPEGVKRMLPYMIRGNWLVHYARIEGINRALTGMSRRTPYESRMDEAANDLQKYFNEFKAEFELFFPELKLHAENFLKSY